MMKILRVRACLLKLMKNLILKYKVDLRWMFKILWMSNKKMDVPITVISHPLFILN